MRTLKIRISKPTNNNKKYVVCGGNTFEDADRLARGQRLSVKFMIRGQHPDATTRLFRSLK